MIFERVTMAPPPPLAEAATMPLADYFFIAGIESSQVMDEKYQPSGIITPQPEPVDETIEENTVLEIDLGNRPISAEGLNGIESSMRSARFSYEARKSIISISGSESKITSNRSSVTIKQVPSDSEEFGSGSLWDLDFDKALRKFVSERDSFIEEIQFNAGTLPQMRGPKVRPKTQRIMADENQAGSLISGVGSIRKRLSTMSSLKRQPSLMRSCKLVSKQPSFQLVRVLGPPVFEEDGEVIHHHYMNYKVSSNVTDNYL